LSRTSARVEVGSPTTSASHSVLNSWKFGADLSSPTPIRSHPERFTIGRPQSKVEREFGSINGVEPAEHFFERQGRLQHPRHDAGRSKGRPDGRWSAPTLYHRGRSRNGTERFPSLRMPRIVPSNRRLRFDGPLLPPRRLAIRPYVIFLTPTPARRVLHCYIGCSISPPRNGRGATLLRRGDFGLF
jgi:hypothetical protein